MSLSFFARRAVLREAKDTLSQGRAWVKTYKKRMSNEGVDSVTATLDALAKKIEATPVPATVSEFRAELDDVIGALDRHLPKDRKSPARESIEGISKAVLLALFLRAFLFEAFKIPSGSMIPTLEIGDQIFVNKYVYGLRIPFTFIRFFTFNDPKPGEVIVFIYPLNHDKDFIKRVVAVAGDTVEVRGGQLFVNQKMVERVPQAGPCTYWDKDPRSEQWVQNRCEGFTEQLASTPHPVIHATDGRRAPDYGPEQIKPGHLFVMGDNRDNSSDSRVWGQVPLQNVKGRAMFVWWPWSQNGLNFSRMFTWIR